MNQIPEKLNDFRVYLNGNNLVGIADVQLPSFEHITETIKGAGIAGEYESPTIGHFQSQKVTINWRVLNESVVSLIAPVVGTFDIRGANQILDAATGSYIKVPCRVLVRGIANKNELGKMEKGSPYDASSEVEINYIKIQVNGKTLVELDKLNYKFEVNGVDYLADIRKALGMN
ncbi:phage major tail tube protein [Thermaerobacillus caldiproteolyticus]|uniref:phage major tail tube protein n=1 Tax=Thermaerobacillus caldiproteolyticus TaxID=247480 RepID=UPI00188D9E13|nr:phage major tail tube protein [Anoxybacillus caldiproteolyticus]QPA33433.1 phage major tail tube protein [Anoxybacillus caldiproteolyticus]